MGIKVRAFRQGLYGHFREPGDEFEIADEQAFSDTWMEKLDRNGKPIKSTNNVRQGIQYSTGHNPVTGPTKDITSDLV